ncbi:MAG TPA: DUF3108 domain-containing protein [Leeuwenhoekiella sp.]|uniref:DUF3108 domain-containing protein n=1 Tax=Leeuwenhoekiella palythoae TaxID=573501 RepID=UPI000C5266B7|nr:DUF3108 domain-containing protein [Leeuwenhoekiella palythoae]MBH13688.1 ATP-dependent exonuclease [Leeuwenhoekiella sp.]UBZ12040.1 DUF3108 domain-containing protein [Leeuwenhoekiella palythoae]HCQ77204.1 DUF3108 domain-containing protein [Leeuwenhoekiella sp.]|tara:strand:- start:4005 stop:4781 length:777 start_codon:yes stop_codon:yes gene_type:complete
MKNKYLVLLMLLVSGLTYAQEAAFQDGEWFRFRISYSGWWKAGEATLSVTNETLKGKPVYHVKGKGVTTGMTKLFFGVEDYYETYIDKNTTLPYRFIRKIDEGGHTKDKIIDFNQQSNVATVNDKKHNEVKTFQTEPNIHDMVSAFYYLRNSIDSENLKDGDETVINMFFDQENFKFKLKFLGREEVKTKFGKVKALIFRPYVQAGRVFKEKESLTVWISDDQNKIPLQIKADLAVGSLKADIDAYKGLKHPFYIIQD